MDKYAHRKSQITLTLVDEHGHPMPGQKIEAELTNPEFLWGAGTFWINELKDPRTSAARRDFLQQCWEDFSALLNYGTLSFYQGRYEPVEGKTLEEETLRAARFMHENGITAKGHPLVWHTVSANWLKPKTDEEVLANQLGRIQRDMTAFKGLVTLWDVINEVVIMPDFVNEPDMNAITRLCRKMGRVPLVKAVFDAARAANPDATLLLNDFNTSERYRQLIEDCLAADVPIDVIGIQSHQHQGFWGLEKLHEVLHRFEGFNKPLHFTENTFVSGHLMPAHIVDLNDYQIPDWPTTPEGEDRQARDLLAMADTLFAHPQVEAFTSWNFTDEAWLGAPAGLIRKDGSRKPGYDALYQRIRKDWSTRVSAMTDENGQITLEGFRGQYALRCNGRQAAFTLGKQTPAETIRL